MKKLIIANCILAVAVILSFCTKADSNENSGLISQVATERGAVAGGACPVLMQVTMPTPCDTMFWSVSVGTATSINAPCEEPSTIVAEFGRSFENPNGVTQQTVWIPKNGACFHVYGYFPAECTDVKLTYYDANGAHVVDVIPIDPKNPDPSGQIPCTNFCASCLGQ